MYVLHMNMPERVRDSANMGGQNLQILTFKCDGDLVLYIRGRGGGGGGTGEPGK